MGKRKPSWKAIAKKHFGQDSTYRRGDGGFALVTPCREVHFSLWSTPEEAQEQKATVDNTGCGGDCTPWRHYVLELQSTESALGA